MRHRRAWLHWRAVQRHGDIQPCGGKTWPECYTYEYPAIPAAVCQGTQYVQFATKKNRLTLWYETRDGSTHIIQEYRRDVRTAN